MSEDTANLLREHVRAVKELIAGDKPDRKPAPKEKKTELEDER